MENHLLHQEPGPSQTECEKKQQHWDDADVKIYNKDFIAAIIK